MRQKNACLLFLILLGASAALGGCEKVAPAELRLRPAAQTSQQLVAPGRTQPTTPAQLAWARFVDKVERGEQVDPTGQYVSKAAVLTAKQAGERARRPKHDMAQGVPAGLVIKADGTAVPAGSQNLLADPDNPPVLCPQGCPDTGGGSSIASTFVSSEGLAPYSGADNPNGYIHDLKITFIDAHDPGRWYKVTGEAYSTDRAGYTRLDADLNKGAGGPYIYLSFTRNPSQVWQGGAGVLQGSTTPLTGIKAKSICCFYNSYPAPDPDFVRILGAHDNSDDDALDLNVGAGGYYVYPFQSKNTGQGTPIEVGVLSGNSSSISPPSGWTKVNQDLNEGAGGDYIYFCFKRR